MKKTVYQCFADVPGVDIPQPAHKSSEQPDEFGMWPSMRGTIYTSASPASQLSSCDWSLLSTEQAQERLEQILALPGSPADYHFALMGCYKSLWKRRGDDPFVLPEVERLCKMDIQLFDHQCDEICFYGIPLPSPEERRYVSVPAYSILIQLYLNEGFFKEAVDVASRAQKAGQGDDHLREISERMTRLATPESEL